MEGYGSHAIIFVCSGIVNIEYESASLSVKAGQCVFVRRNHLVRLHKMSAEGKPYSAINILLKYKCVRRYVREHKDSGCRIREKRRTESALILPCIDEVESLKETLMPYFCDKEKRPADGLIEDIAGRAIGLLISMDERFCPTLFDFLETWKINLSEFMEKNFAEDMTISEFARYSGRSLASFKRDFAKFYNLPPEKWLTVRRLEEAYCLLQAGEKSVSEVCWCLGFHSRAHFTTAFKRQYNILPSEIKKSNS